MEKQLTLQLTLEADPHQRFLRRIFPRALRGQDKKSSLTVRASTLERLHARAREAGQILNPQLSDWQQKLTLADLLEAISRGSVHVVMATRTPAAPAAAGARHARSDRKRHASKRRHLNPAHPAERARHKAALAKAHRKQKATKRRKGARRK